MPAAAQERAEAARSEAENARESATSLRVQLEAASEAARVRGASLKDAEARAVRAEADGDALRARMEEMQEEIGTLREAAAAAGTSAAQVAELQARIQSHELDTQAGADKDALASLRSRNDAFKSRISHLEGVVARAEADLDASKRDARDARDASLAVQERLVGLGRAAEDARSAAESAREQVSDLRA